MCSGEEVGASFERTESQRQSNRATSGRRAATAWHRQIGAEPRVVSGKPELRTPNREWLGAEVWWRNAEPNPRPLSETDSNRWVLRARIRPFGRVCSQQRYIFDQTRPASLSFDLIIRVVCPRVRRTTPRPVCASNAHQANLSCHAGNCSVKRLSASTEGDSMAASLYP